MERWLTPKKILGIGLPISVVAWLVWSASGNSIAASILIIVGAMTLPLAVMVMLYRRLGGVPVGTLANCFMVGGAIGLVLAGALELSFPTSRTFSGYIGVGLIEETSKIVFPIALFFSWRYKKLSSGLLIGIASGMGFAVMETIGRALVDLLTNNQDVGYTLLTRGFFTPFGHPAWTGLICAVLWKARIKANSNSAVKVIGIFLTAVLLHATWNTLNRIDVPDIITAAMLMGLGMIIMWLVFLQFEQAEREAADV